MTRSLLVAGAVTISIVMIVLVCLIPPIAERVVTTQIQSLASTRGVDAQWGDINWSFDGLSVADVRIRHRKVMTRAPQVILDLTPMKYVMGGPLVDGLHFQSPVLKFQRLETSQGSVDIESVTEPAAVRKWPDWLRRVTADGVKLLVQKGPRILTTIEADALSAVFEEGRLIARGQAHVIGTTLDMDCELEVNRELRAGTARCEGVSGLPIQWAHDDLKVQVAQLSGTLAEEDGIRVQLKELRVERGSVSGDFREIILGRGRGRNSLGLIGGVLRVVRKKRSPKVAPKTVLDRATSPKNIVERLSEVREKFGSSTSMLSYFDSVRWEGLALETPWLPRVTGIDGQLDGEHIQLQAVMAGGRIRAEGKWSPGWGVIERIRLTTSGLQLGPVFARRLPANAPGRSSNGRVDGELSGRIDIVSVGDDGGHLIYDADMAWLGGRVELAGVADEPITGIALRIGSAGELSIPQSTLESSTTMTLGPLSVTTNLKITDWPDDPVIDVSVKGRSLPCEEALAALPSKLLGPYERVAATGSFSPKVHFHWPLKRPKKIKLKFRDIIRSCRIAKLNTDPDAQPAASGRNAARLPLDDVAWLNRSFIFRVHEGVQDGASIAVGPGTDNFVPLAELPAYVGAAAYLSEEIHFYKNRPIDPGLVGRALRLNLEHGRFVYGGSTVTQQLVKNLFLTRKKTLARKLQEILVAARITEVVSRERVLELYLNCIEFGPNIFGIARAAQYYFQKDARQLTPREAVFLAMLKPAPRRGGWMKRRGYTPRVPYWDYRATEIMGRLVDKGYLTQSQIEAEKPYSIQWEQGRYLGRNLE